MNVQPGQALTKAEYDALVEQLGRPVSWPPIGRRRLGAAPDNSVATNHTSNEGTSR